MNKQGRVKKVPLRKCLATNQQFPKKEMIRVVRTPEGNVIVAIAIGLAFGIVQGFFVSCLKSSRLLLLLQVCFLQKV